jgi:hypothetical protein
VGISLTFGQASSEIGKITFSIIMPDNIDGLDVSQLSKLETKITQIVAENGIAASGYNNNFVIYPKFSVYEVNNVEGGMQNITVSTCELSLFIKQIENNLLFCSVSKQIKGSGQNKSLSLTSAIAKIPVNDSQFKTFLETGKSKIIKYYSDKCQDIIDKADKLTKIEKFEEALGLLMTVPEEVPSCYNKIQTKSIETYKEFKNHQCLVLIQNAKTKMASNQYKQALEILKNVEPSSGCFKQADEIITKASSKIDIEEKKLWNLQLKMYNDDVALEKQRINAIKEIASAYYKSQPKTINYSYIIK